MWLQGGNTELNLLYVMGEFPSLYQGTVLSELSILRSLGHSVHILALRRPRHTNHTAAEAMADLITYGLDLRGSRWTVLKSNLALITQIGPAAYWNSWVLVQRYRVMLDFRGFMRLAAAAYRLRQRGLNHLHAHWAHEATEMALILSSVLGLPYSFTCHAVDIFVSPRHLRDKLESARFVVTVSGYNRRYLLDQYGQDLEEKIHVIYPLLDTGQFTPRHPPSGKDINILSVGRLVEKKGYPYAIEAARLLQERGYRFVWRIVGEGTDRSQLEAAITEPALDGCIELTGKLPRQSVGSLLDEATVFVLPSVIASNGDREGMPLVLLEAMAKEVPVITTTAVGTDELVKDGAGLLVPPRDSASLANAIEQVITLDRASLQRMGQIGRRIVMQEFNTRELANKLIALFEAQLAG